MTSAMRTPATASPGPGGRAELPIVTLTRNVNASNVGTGKNLAAISNYYTRLAINDNNFLRVRGYLLSEAGLALSASSVPVSLGGFVASFFIVAKDILNVVTAALAITTSSIALLRALPAAPTPGVTTTAIAANLAGLQGRHLLGAQYDENATHAEVFAANQSRMFEQFSKTAFSNGDNPQDLYCSVTTNIARINLLQDGLNTVQTILSNQSSNLAFIAAEIALAASIINEVANILAITGDVITYLLRFPSLAIQVGQLEISAITFESTLERDYSPGGAAYADLQRFLTAIDTYRRALGQGSLQSMVTNAQKQLNTARSMLVGTVAPKSA
ncbi:MAG: hypothetical protein WDW38_011329 [Sanguina aurantia]